MLSLTEFRETWFVDFEFQPLPGERPLPICMVGRELRSGRILRLWEDDLRELASAPYPTTPDVLFVAFYASAELGCHLALGWPLPERVIDLYAEFRNFTNGLDLPCGRGLLGALAYFGIEGIPTVEKESMRELAIRGGPWSAEEKRALLEYCESDVVALSRLFSRMEHEIDPPRAILRGRYMAAAARMEHIGIPIDVPTLVAVRDHWQDIQKDLISEVDAEFGVFEGTSFKSKRFESWLQARGLPWPRRPSGTLALDDVTWKDMARVCPALEPLRDLRASLSQLRLSDLSVGRDGRNRAVLSAYRARTGRNQPSTSKFIFGPAVWTRGLIKPALDYGIAYVDWSQQEFGIAAALSKDPNMIRAYESGDPYLAFAKQAGRVPSDGTKDTHRKERDLFKACALAVQYGMGCNALAARIDRSRSEARELLDLHRYTYPVFWRWSDAAVDHASLRKYLPTVFGWVIHIGPGFNPRALRNFPMQANGAEMLRLACSLATEEGIRICAPVHDALLVESPLDNLDATVARTQELMAEASRVVLEGFELRSDVKVVRYPDRYMDSRGERMWNTVSHIMERLERVHHCHDWDAPAHTRSISSLG